eukprot:ANDGO_00695.mRNA.1 Factor arrest protein 11
MSNSAPSTAESGNDELPIPDDLAATEAWTTSHHPSHLLTRVPIPGSPDSPTPSSMATTATHASTSTATSPATTMATGVGSPLPSRPIRIMQRGVVDSPVSNSSASEPALAPSFSDDASATYAGGGGGVVGAASSRKSRRPLPKDSLNLDSSQEAISMMSRMETPISGRANGKDGAGSGLGQSAAKGKMSTMYERKPMNGRHRYVETQSTAGVEDALCETGDDMEHAHEANLQSMNGQIFDLRNAPSTASASLISSSSSTLSSSSSSSSSSVSGESIYSGEDTDSSSGGPSRERYYFDWVYLDPRLDWYYFEEIFSYIDDPVHEPPRHVLWSLREDKGSFSLPENVLSQSIQSVFAPTTSVSFVVDRLESLDEQVRLCALRKLYDIALGIPSVFFIGGGSASSATVRIGCDSFSDSSQSTAPEKDGVQRGCDLLLSEGCLIPVLQFAMNVCSSAMTRVRTDKDIAKSSPASSPSQPPPHAQSKLNDSSQTHMQSTEPNAQEAAGEFSADSPLRSVANSSSLTYLRALCRWSLSLALLLTERCRQHILRQEKSLVDGDGDGSDHSDLTANLSAELRTVLWNGQSPLENVSQLLILVATDHNQVLPVKRLVLLFEKILVATCGPIDSCRARSCVDPIVDGTDEGAASSGHYTNSARGSRQKSRRRYLDELQSKLEGRRFLGSVPKSLKEAVDVTAKHALEDRVSRVTEFVNRMTDEYHISTSHLPAFSTAGTVSSADNASLVVEDYFTRMVPQMDQFVNALLKIMYASLPSAKKSFYRGHIFFLADLERFSSPDDLPAGVTYATAPSPLSKLPELVATMGKSRCKSIVLRSVGHILLLLLKKWKRVLHGLPSEDFAMRLVDGKVLLLILKFLTALEWQSEMIHEMLDWPIFSGSISEYPTKINFRAWSITVLFLRVLQKLTKHVNSRVSVLVHFKAHSSMKRMLLVSNEQTFFMPEVNLYSLKIIKSMAPLLGRKFRGISANLKLVSLIYHNLKNDIGDMWLTDDSASSSSTSSVGSLSSKEEDTERTSAEDKKDLAAEEEHLKAALVTWIAEFSRRHRIPVSGLSTSLRNDDLSVDELFAGTSVDSFIQDELSCF